MTTKNKRTSLKKETLVEKRLKDKLKSEYKKSLKEANDDDFSDQDNLDDDTTPVSDDEEGFDQQGGDDFGGDLSDSNESSEDFSDEDLDDDDEYDFDSLDDDQKAWFDDEVDDLLEPAAHELEDEEHAGADDLDIETESDDLGAGEDDGPFSAEELNSLIASDDTLHDLEGELTDLADDVDDHDGEDFDVDDDHESDEDFEDDNFDDELSDDDEMLESELMAEAEIEHELNEKMNPKKKSIKKEATAKEWPGKRDVKWTKEKKPSDVQKSEYSSVTQPTDGHAKGVAETKEGLQQKMKNLKRESVEKSKMLVLAANRIKKLQEANSRLKVENLKLMKTNGILSAVGSKLDTKSRAFVSESFSKCKTEQQIEKLYEKIVKTIKQKSRKSINESVVAKTKPQNSRLLDPKNPETLNESKEMSFEMKRKMHLMGLAEGEDAYYNLY